MQSILAGHLATFRPESQTREDNDGLLTVLMANGEVVDIFAPGAVVGVRAFANWALCFRRLDALFSFGISDIRSRSVNLLCCDVREGCVGVRQHERRSAWKVALRSVDQTNDILCV